MVSSAEVEMKGVVNEEGLAWKCPIRTEEQIGWETVGKGEIHVGHVIATQSGDLDLDGRKLAARFIEDARKVEGIDSGSRDT